MCAYWKWQNSVFCIACSTKTCQRPLWNLLFGFDSNKRAGLLNHGTIQGFCSLEPQYEDHCDYRGCWYDEISSWTEWDPSCDHRYARQTSASTKTWLIRPKWISKQPRVSCAWRSRQDANRPNNLRGLDRNTHSFGQSSRKTKADIFVLSHYGEELWIVVSQGVGFWKVLERRLWPQADWQHPVSWRGI